MYLPIRSTPSPPLWLGPAHVHCAIVREAEEGMNTLAFPVTAGWDSSWLTSAVTFSTRPTISAFCFSIAFSPGQVPNIFSFFSVLVYPQCVHQPCRTKLASPHPIHPRPMVRQKGSLTPDHRHAAGPGPHSRANMSIYPLGPAFSVRRRGINEIALSWYLGACRTHETRLAHPPYGVSVVHPTP